MKLLKSEKGMTVVEILVALTILGLVSVGLMGFFTDSFKFQARNQQTVIVQKLADEAIESLKNNKGIINTFNITDSDFEDGEFVDVTSDDDTEYNTYLKVNNVLTINDATGITLYDVTLEMVSKTNSSIIGTVNTTIRINNNGSIDDEDRNNNGGDNGGDDIATDGYDLIYLPNGDGVKNMPSNKEFSKAGTYSLAIFEPTRTGYEFIGWNESAAATVAQYIPGGDIEIDQDKTLYAVWKQQIPKYTLTYHANGGSGAPANRTLESGTSVTISSVKPTRTGWTFMGWAEVSSAAGINYTSGQSNAFTITSDKTLYAVWARTIKFDYGNYTPATTLVTLTDITLYENGWYDDIIVNVSGYGYTVEIDNQSKKTFYVEVRMNVNEVEGTSAFKWKAIDADTDKVLKTSDSNGKFLDSYDLTTKTYPKHKFDSNLILVPSGATVSSSTTNTSQKCTVTFYCCNECMNQVGNKYEISSETSQTAYISTSNSGYKTCANKNKGVYKASSSYIDFWDQGSDSTQFIITVEVKTGAPSTASVYLNYVE